jgi:outer membrane protein assembly factor BamB
MRGATALACAVAMAAVAAPAAAQIPLPPLPPLPPPAEPPPPDGSRPDPEQPGPPAPQPVSETPGSVASAVDVGHSGSLPTESLVPPLRKRWSVPMSAVSILAAEGRVFAAGATLTAFDQATGKTVWSVPLQRSPDGAVYDAGMIFVIVGDDLQAYRAGDGSLVWQQRIEGIGYTGGPVATGGTVYVTQRGNIVNALRGSDGGNLWSKPGGDYLPAVDDTRLYFAGACGSALALARSDGRQLWSREGGCTSSGSTPSLFSGRLWLPEQDGNDSTINDPAVLNAADGSLAGRHPYGAPVFQEGLAIFSDSDGTSAVSLSSLKQKWRVEKSGVGSIGIGHDLYVVRRDNRYLPRVVALAGASGAELWSAPVPRAPGPSGEGAALGAAPDLLLISADGRLTAFETALRPEPRGIALGTSTFDTFAGQNFALIGVLGTELRAGRPRVTIRAADWHKGRLRPIGHVRPSRDGGFVASVNSAKNARWRVTTGGRGSNVLTVFVYPKVRLGRPRFVSRTRARLPVKVAAPHSGLAGHRVVLYLQQTRRSKLVRLGSGRMSGRRGHARASVLFKPVRHVAKQAIVWNCIVGQLRMRLGRPSPLTRHCGRRVLARP